MGFPVTRFALGIPVCLLAVAVLLVITFAAGRRAHRHSVVDVAWGLGYAVIALVSFGFSSGHGATSQRVLLAVMTAVWGARLGGYIGLRQRGAGEDPRYTDLLDRAAAKSPGASRNALAARKIYLTQGLTMLFVSLPVQVGMYEHGSLGAAGYLGITLWLIGLFFEGVGDYQMARFKADPRNKGKIMDRGLWGWTRHPNYFGDACVWWGLFLVAAGHWPGVLTVLSPLLMNAFLARGTGKATLEKHMGDRPGFEEYLAATSGFFPLPPPLTRALHSR